LFASFFSPTTAVSYSLPVTSFVKCFGGKPLDSLCFIP
jgi:hypothetical protein